MKVFVLSEIVILFAIYLQSKNEVYSEENGTLPKLNETTEANLTASNFQDQQNETSSLKSNITEPSANETSKTDIVVNNETSKDSIATTNSTGSNNDNDESVAVVSFSNEMRVMRDEELNASGNQTVAKLKNKSHKSAVELIASHSHNNSFVLTNLLNFSRNKNDVSPIGEPVDLAGFIETVEFKNVPIWYHNKTTSFNNIHVSGIPSTDSIRSYYNNFTCTSQQFGIVLNVIPENMTFVGDYVILDSKTNETSNGTFVFNQTEARLWYKFPNISELRKNGHDLETYGDIYFGDGQMKFTQLCDKQCDLLATSSLMFNIITSHMLENLNVSFISKPIDQFISTFPFLSICSPAPPSTPQLNKTTNYYVIDEIVEIGKNTEAPLRLGPMIIKGLDNFTGGNVVAMKGQLRESPNHFLLTTQASQIQGQCDWRLLETPDDSDISSTLTFTFQQLKENPNQSVINSSFTFIIEQVRFSIGADFSESWNVNHLDIHFDKISIHRLDKSSPKMLGFIKIILEDFVQDAVRNSLVRLFNQHFPRMVTTTTSKTTHIPITKPKTTATRQVVYWTPFQPSNETRVTEDNKDHLPFPRRKVFTPCKDTRKWWQKLFYRNKCKDRVHEEY